MGVRGLQFAKVFADLELNTKGFHADLAQSEKSLGRIERFIIEHPMAAAGSLAATLVLVGVKATKMAADTEAGIRRIGAVLPDAVSKAAAIKHQIDEIATSSGRSQQELLSTAEVIAKGGVASTEELLQRLRVVQTAADATGADLNTLATGLDQVLDVFGLTGDQIEEVAAKLRAAGQGREPIEDLLASFQTAAPTLKAAGVSFDVATAALSRFVAEGLNAKQANAALKELVTEGGAKAVEEFGGKALDAAAAIESMNTAADLVANGAPRLAARMQATLNETLRELGDKVLPTVLQGLQGIVIILDHLNGTLAEISRNTAIGTINQLAPVGATKLKEDEEAAKRLAAALTQVAQAAFDGSLSLKDLSRDQLETLQLNVKKAAAEVGDQLVDIVRLKVPILQGLITEALKTAPLTPLVVPSGKTTSSTTTPVITPEQQAAIDRAALKLRKGITEAFTDTLPTTIDATAIAIAHLSAELTESGAPAAEVTKALKPLIDQLDHLRDAALGEQIRQTLESVELSSGDDLDRQAALIEAAVNRLRELRAQKVETLGTDQTGPESVQTLSEIATLDQQIEETNKRLVAARKEAAAAAERVEVADTGSAAALETARTEIEKSKRHVTDLARGIGDVARGAIGAAQALGGMTDATAATFQNVITIAETLPGLISELSHLGDFGNKFDFTSFATGAAAVIGGLSGFVSQILGGGESPAEKRAREVASHNSDVIEKLTREIGNLTLKISGNQFAAGQRAVDALLRQAATRGGTGLGVRGFNPNELDDKAVRRILSGAGTTLSELQDLAAQLGDGITLDTSSTARFIESLKALQEALAKTELFEFAHTLEGRLAALDAEASFFGLTAQEQLEAIAKEFENTVQQVDLSGNPIGEATGSPAPIIAEALKGLDLSLAKDREEFKRRLGEILKGLSTDAFVGKEALFGDLTPEQLRDLILKLGGLIDQMGETDAGAGSSQNFVEENRITETTGTRLAGILESGLIYHRETADNTAKILDALLGGAVPQLISPPSAATVSGAGLAGTEVTVTIQSIEFVIAPGQPASQAMQAAEVLVDQVERLLADRINDRQARRGKTLQ